MIAKSQRVWLEVDSAQTEINVRRLRNLNMKLTFGLAAHVQRKLRL